MSFQSRTIDVIDSEMLNLKVYIYFNQKPDQSSNLKLFKSTFSWNLMDFFLNKLLWWKTAYFIFILSCF